MTKVFNTINFSVELSHILLTSSYFTLAPISAFSSLAPSFYLLHLSSTLDHSASDILIQILFKVYTSSCKTLLLPFPFYMYSSLTFLLTVGCINLS